MKGKKEREAVPACRRQRRHNNLVQNVHRLDPRLGNRRKLPQCDKDFFLNLFLRNKLSSKHSSLKLQTAIISHSFWEWLSWVVLPQGLQDVSLKLLSGAAVFEDYMGLEDPLYTDLAVGRWLISSAYSPFYRLMMGLTPRVSDARHTP